MPVVSSAGAVFQRFAYYLEKGIDDGVLAPIREDWMSHVVAHLATNMDKGEWVATTAWTTVLCIRPYSQTALLKGYITLCAFSLLCSV